jgi:uncharacterized repeat protein (TIGR02543 family)
MTSARALLLASLAALAACGGSGAGSGGGSVTGPVLTVTVTGFGRVTGSPPSASCASGTCSNAQPSGTSVTLVPAAGSGWAFTGWSGDCTGAGSCTVTMASSRTVTASFTPAAPLGSNVMTLSVNGSTCGSGAGAYQNKPCVRVTVCLPGTSTCATVDDVLLDTGSYGLRLFKEVLPFSLPLVAAGAGTLAECVPFLDGSSDWGPVASADVVLGGEAPVRVPIQVIDATFGHLPSACATPETSAAAAGFNGILGVGLFAEDCGSHCASSAANGYYFACSSTACSGTSVPLSGQVPNPVARLPADNNGVIVVLPSLPPGGQVSVEGWLLLGIDTQANNRSTGATAYGANSLGDIRTSFDGAILAGYLDTGSNGLFFPAPRSGALPACQAPDAAWYCPAATVALSATNAGTSGSPSDLVAFSIGNALGLFTSSNGAVDEVGGPMPAGSGFDHGLPFFFGRQVYFGIEATRSSGLGLGPYFAY